MKKIKRFLKDLFRRELKVVSTHANAFNVIEVDKGCNSLTQGLGMSEERGQTLAKLANMAFIESDNLVQAGETVSKHCKHANELFFVSVVLTHRMRDNNSGPGGLLQALMRGRQSED